MGWRGVSERGGEVGVAEAPEKTELRRSERNVKVDAPGGCGLAAYSPSEPQRRSCRDQICIMNHQAQVINNRHISKTVDFKNEFPNVGIWKNPGTTGSALKQQSSKFPLAIQPSPRVKESPFEHADFHPINAVFLCLSYPLSVPLARVSLRPMYADRSVFC